jgi:hypothetical protein
MTLPVPVTAPFEMRTVSHHSNTEVSYSNPTCMTLCAFTLRVVLSLRWADPPTKEPCVSPDTIEISSRLYQSRKMTYTVGNTPYATLQNRNKIFPQNILSNGKLRTGSSQK